MTGNPEVNGLRVRVADDPGIIPSRLEIEIPNAATSTVCLLHSQLSDTDDRAVEINQISRLVAR
jgi:hypothetical protein